MIIKAITWETDLNGSHVKLDTSQRELERELKGVKLDNLQEVEVIIRNKRKKRSLDANAYMWVLCDKIAKAIRSTKEDVYKLAIMSVGRFDDIAIPTASAAEFIANWKSKGDGWIAEIRKDCKLPKCSKIRCYYGSSTYDTKEMSRLIDCIVDEAKGLGIETMTPNELAELKGAWK